MTEPSSNDRAGDGADPVWRHSRREMVGILLVFVVFLAWTVGASAAWGYGESARTTIVAGVPAWIWLGVAAPWAAATAATVAFAMMFLRDDDLGEQTAEPDAGRESQPPSDA